jgi:hypothetical protein
MGGRADRPRRLGSVPRAAPVGARSGARADGVLRARRVRGVAFRRLDVPGAVPGCEFQPVALARCRDQGRCRHTSGTPAGANSYADAHASADANTHADAAPDAYAHPHAHLAAVVAAAAPQLAAAESRLAAVASPSPLPVTMVVNGERAGHAGRRR